MILLCQLLLTVVLITYFFLGGFTKMELTTLLGYFLPMTSLYIVVVLKFAFENRYLSDGPSLSASYSSFAFYLLLILFVLSFLFISLKALFNSLEFEELKVLLLIIQSGIGCYAGYFLTDLFNTKR